MYTITSNVVVTGASIMESAKSNSDGYQNILMMRHGDRIDKIEPLWLDTATRPWDPPLVHDGMLRAFQTGQRIRSQIQFPIHRVFVSPFIRCIQTASQVIAALSAVDFDPNATSSKDVTSIDKSKLKVCIEFGLSEMLNTIAIKPEIAPKDGKFDFMISDLEAMFPHGMVDHHVDPVYKEMPQWEETVEGCTDRFLNLVKTLADKYPSENLLLVTHGEGVRTTFSTFKDVDVYDVEYCACAELRRQVSSLDGSTKAGNFESEKGRERAMESPKSKMDDGYQNIFVMRHGDRIDNFEPLWVSTAERPWDPPLIQDGMIRAFRTGQRIRSQITFPIHRVFVSPFFRCIQTAYEVVSALSAVNVDPNAMSSKDVPSIDQSKLKVAIELGLCEMLNSVAIRRELAPKDGNFDFSISDLEAMFPEGMVDHNVDMVYKQLPKWEESVEGCRDRYVEVIKALADKYPSENLLLVTHGEGVGTTFSTFFKDATVYEVDYCAFVELRREISSEDGSVKAGDYEVVLSHGQAGIRFSHDPVISQTPV